MMLPDEIYEDIHALFNKTNEIDKRYLLAQIDHSMNENFPNKGGIIALREIVQTEISNHFSPIKTVCKLWMPDLKLSYDRVIRLLLKADINEEVKAELTDIFRFKIMPLAV